MQVKPFSNKTSMSSRLTEPQTFRSYLYQGLTGRFSPQSGVVFLAKHVKRWEDSYCPKQCAGTALDSTLREKVRRE